MKKRILTLLLVTALALSLAACGSKAADPAGPGAADKAKTFTLTVVRLDGESVHTLTSNRDTLGEALSDSGLIAGEEGAYGLFVKTVDGVTVDESREQWWRLTKSGEQVNTGVDSTPFADGDAFEFTLTEGY